MSGVLSPTAAPSGQDTSVDKLHRLDTHARLAALVPDNSLAIVAPAGSGKTAVMTTRVLSLLASGVPPERIAVVTFTRAATQEIAERVEKLLEDPSDLEAIALGGLRDAYLGLVHAIREKKLTASSVIERLQITTIDALTRSLAANHPEFPLGLQVLPDIMTNEFGEWVVDALMLDPGGAADAITQLQRHYARDGSWIRNRLCDTFNGLRQAGIYNQDLEILQAEGWKAMSIHGLYILELALRDTRYHAKFTELGIGDALRSLKIKRGEKDASTAAFSSYGRALGHDLTSQLPHEVLVAMHTCMTRMFTLATTIAHRRRRVDHLQMQWYADGALKYGYTSNIDHLLIDEFQDSNASQIEMFKELCEGFGDDGRTVFLVGDPMQECYAFRGSDSQGFAAIIEQENFGPHLPIQIHHLHLCFRSTPEVVASVRAFAACKYPDDDTLEWWRQGVRVKPTPALSSRGRTDQRADEFVLSHDEDALTDELLSRARQMRDSGKSVAILVRLRRHGTAITKAAHERGLKVQWDSGLKLQEHQGWSALESLVQFLADRGNINALVRLLRSPLAGMSLDQLAVLFRRPHGPHYLIDLLLPRLNSVFAATDEPTQATRRRVVRFINTITRVALDFRDHPLSTRVSAAWRALGGEELAGEYQAGFDHALQTLGDLVHLYSEAQAAAVWCEQEHTLPPSVSTEDITVSTIHKAKGKEWDHVLIYNEDKKKRKMPLRVSQSLLNDVLLPEEGATELRKVHHFETGAKQNFRKMIDNWTSLEQERKLGYVALTRARQGIVLFSLADEARSGDQRIGGEQVEKPEQTIRINAFDQSYALELDSSAVKYVSGSESEAEAEEASVGHAGSWAISPDSRALYLPFRPRTRLPIDLDRYSRAVGLTIHDLLAEWDAQRPLNEMAEIPPPVLAGLLRRHGVASSQIPRAVAHANRHFTTVSQSPEFAEIKQSAQFEVSLVHDHKDYRIDAVEYRDDGIYISEFKSDEPRQGENDSSFLFRLLYRHRQQVLGYIEALSALYPDRKVTGQIYSTALGKVIAVEPGKPQDNY